MEIRLAPDIVNGYRDRINNLLFELKPPSQTQTCQDSFQAKPYVSGVIGPEGINNIHLTAVDGYGNKQASFFAYNEAYIGLEAEAYKEFKRIAEGIQRSKPIQEYISLEFACVTLFEWMEKKYKNQIQVDSFEYLENVFQSSIKEQEIWLPLANICIQVEFSIGKVIFKPVTKAVIDAWEANCRQKDQNEQFNLEKYFIILRKEIQGGTVATVKVLAEKIKAIEIAVQESEKAIAVLRIFASPPIIPEAISYLDLLGSVHKEYLRYFSVENDRLTFESSCETDNTLKQLAISGIQIDLFQKSGMTILSELLLQGPKTQFEKQVLDALFMYSKSERMANLTDRLLYVFAAIESILKSDKQESIQQNIGDRIAFFIGNSVDQRKAIVKNVKEIYGMRSAFVHYGKQPKTEQREKIFEFLQTIFLFFHTIIMNINKFENKDAFLDAIENCKYSGGIQ